MCQSLCIPKSLSEQRAKKCGAREFHATDSVLVGCDEIGEPLEFGTRRVIVNGEAVVYLVLVDCLKMRDCPKPESWDLLV